jgi:hypothetical protein
MGHTQPRDYKLWGTRWSNLEGDVRTPYEIILWDAWNLTSSLHTQPEGVWGIYTLTLSRITQKLPAGRLGVSGIFLLPGLRTYMVKYTFVYNGLHLKCSSTLRPDRQQHDHPAASVIAQQYSPNTAFSLRIHSRREKLAPS